jgi:hypothetical protein
VSLRTSLLSTIEKSAVLEGLPRSEQKVGLSGLHFVMLLVMMLLKVISKKGKYMSGCFEKFLFEETHVI